MRRYQVLRRLGCDPLAAGFIALLNWMRGYPANEIHFTHIVIEVESESLDWLPVPSKEVA